MKPLLPSGSLVPGVDADDFGLPPGMALRFERPAEPLRRHLTSYFVMASVEGVAAPREWMLPGWAMIWILLDPAAVRVEIGNRRYAGLASSVLYGVTSRAMAFNATGGIAVGIDVSPLGWARLFDRSAEALRDRIVPLVEMLPADFVEELYLALMASDRALGVKAVLDRLFLPIMPTPHRDEDSILKVLRLLEDGGFTDVASAARRAQDLCPRSTARLARSFFGFPPKTLMMRARFLRALVPLLDRERSTDEAVSTGYYDRSHFNRDARRYLGMSPQRYIDLPSPYAAAARRARRAVIGSPIPALDRIEEPGCPQTG